MKANILAVCAVAAAAAMGSTVGGQPAGAASSAGAIQVVFSDGASVRLDSGDLSAFKESLSGLASADAAPRPALTAGIAQFDDGRLRRLPVLVSRDAAAADASLAVYAAARGDRAAAWQALSRAKDRAGRASSGADWEALSHAHVLLAEAQILDLDDRRSDAEARYLEGIETLDTDPATGALGDVRVLLAAELSRGLAGNLAAQGRHVESQQAARRSVRAYAARFGRAPAYAGGGLDGRSESGFTQVAVSRVPGGQVVGHMLMSGALFVALIADPEDNVREPSGEPGGRERSADGPVEDSGVRNPVGEPGGTPRSTDRDRDDNDRDASGEPGGTSRSNDRSGGDNSKEARGEAGGTSRSNDRSDGDNSKDARGEAGGTSRSNDPSGNTGKEARGKS